MKSHLPETHTQNPGKILAIQREVSGRSIEETAACLGIAPEDLVRIESGEVSPGLPLLESFARLFSIPVELLLSNKSGQSECLDAEKIPALIALRNRIIAVMVKRARMKQDRTVEELAVGIGIEPATMKEYESGKISIPLTHLEGICSALGISLHSLTSTSSQPVSSTIETEDKNIGEFAALPGDLQEFVTNNSNLPYLQLAKRLSEMDAAKLRKIAEGLLEITY